ncbi:MAG: polysaccharide biosynthesis tyrosine autokinase [Tepidisphaeraceae bacterium]|jgi:capsular exopolysaccharide synthesis family protein
MTENSRVERLTISGINGSERPSVGVLLMLWRSRWIVLACLAAAVGAGAFYLSRATPVYSSSSILYIQQAVPNIISDALSTPGDYSGYLFTQCEVIHSTAILSRAVQQPEVASAKCLQGIDNPVAFLKSTVGAAPQKQGDLITVSMESSEPRDAATIVNGVVQAYIGYQSEQHRSTAVEVLRILQGEWQKREDELRANQQRILDFKKANPSLALGYDIGKLLPARFTALTESLTAAQMHTLDMTVAVQQAEAFKNDASQLRRLLNSVDPQYAAANPGSGVDPVLVSAYDEQRQRFLEQSAELGPKNPELIATWQCLELIEQQIEQENQAAAATYLSILRADFDAASRRETALKLAVDAERPNAIDLNAKEAEYDQLLQQSQGSQRELEMLDSRIKAVNLTEDVGHLTASVLETAKPEFNPIRPRSFQVMGMAMVIGLMVGLGSALLREMMEQPLRSVEETANFLGLPILGAVPHISAKNLVATRFTHFGPSWRTYVEFASHIRRLGKMRPAMAMVHRGQEMHLHPASNVAEAYRAIRTAIYFGLGDQPAKTILITSPLATDGKTTLAANLAISIAQVGRRVLLIDADFRNPMQHKIFSLNDERGLSEVLAGMAKLSDVVKKTSIDKLEILPCGNLPTNPAELLNSRALLDLLKVASQSYDQVFVDSPPVIPVSDARVLAASCDGTILTLRAGKSTRRLADQALDALASVGAHVLGVVVNDVAFKRNGQYYQYYAYRTNRRGNGRNGNGDVENPTTSIVVRNTREEEAQM